VLRAASVAGFGDLASLLKGLMLTNFRVSPKLVDGLIAEELERRRLPAKADRS
jgi:hypothetical protein